MSIASELLDDMQRRETAHCNALRMARIALEAVRLEGDCSTTSEQAIEAAIAAINEALEK